MSSLKDLIYDDEEEHIDDEVRESERTYPVKLKVDGYDVNHYYEGDIPVYEIYNKDGSVMDVAYSTNEMHAITGEASKTTDSL